MTTDIEPIKKDVETFLYNFQEVSITTKDEYTGAGDILKQVQNKIKKLEEKRMDYTKPLDESKKRIMTDFKAITEPLENFVELIKGKMLSWYRIEQARLDAEQKKIEEEALKKAKAEKIDEIEVPVINTQLKSQRGDVSTTTVKKTWTFKILDEKLIPREYLSVDSVKIRKAIMEQTRKSSPMIKIDGIEIYQEENISLR